VAIRHTRQIDFCEQKSMYRKIKRSLRERVIPQADGKFKPSR